jgi:ParB-like chromosome segregation protein Spo0J
MTQTAPGVRVHDQIETLALDALVPYARNSRTHSPEQVAQIAASIREFGFTNPVLIDDAGGIIAGHGRVLGARAVGLLAVPCLRLAGLSEAQKRAYVIADNKLALNAGWDEDLLREEMEFRN